MSGRDPTAPALRNPVAVALDTADLDELDSLAARLGPHVGALKVGLQAFVAHGPAAVAAARAHGPVFLDAKLHDIPNTVAGAAAAASGLGVTLLTVHASGGPAMVRAAVEAAGEVTVLAVTVLTSMDDGDLQAAGQPPAAEQVPRLAALAVEAGAGGIVCAPTDARAVRAAVGAAPLLVTPGVRPRAAAGGPAGGEAADDQARVATPGEAVAAGADLLVVGRPVTRAGDPLAAVRAVLEDLPARARA